MQPRHKDIDEIIDGLKLVEMIEIIQERYRSREIMVYIMLS
jgi:hypothetical protein